MASKDEPDDTYNMNLRNYDSNRIVFTNMASGYTVSSFGDYGYFTTMPTTKGIVTFNHKDVIEPEKPQEELTKLINKMERLVIDNPELNIQFRNFLHKHLDPFDLDFEI